MALQFNFNQLFLNDGMMFQNKFQSQKGISIFLVVIVLAVISGVALGLTRIIITEVQTQRGIENSVFTFFAAEAGLEQILYIDIKNSGCDASCLQGHADSLGVLGVVSLPNDATYKIIVEAPSSDCNGIVYCATSIGSFGKGRRVISIEK